RVVVLPQPEGPRREKNSTRSISSDTLSTAMTSSNFLVTCRSSTSTDRPTRTPPSRPTDALVLRESHGRGRSARHPRKPPWLTQVSGFDHDTALQEPSRKRRLPSVPLRRRGKPTSDGV